MLTDYCQSTFAPSVVGQRFVGQLVMSVKIHVGLNNVSVNITSVNLHLTKWATHNSVDRPPKDKHPSLSRLIIGKISTPARRTIRRSAGSRRWTPTGSVARPDLPRRGRGWRWGSRSRNLRSWRWPTESSARRKTCLKRNAGFKVSLHLRFQRNFLQI